MAEPDPADVTALLHRWQGGDGAALDRLIESFARAWLRQTIEHGS